MFGFAWKADTRLGQMSALADTGRSGSLKSPNLSVCYRPVADMGVAVYGVSLVLDAAPLVAAPVAVFPANEHRVYRPFQFAHTKIYCLDRIELYEMDPSAQ